MPQHSAVVVIPTYNEISNISSLMDRILNLDSGFDILIVDDHSPDGTAKVVRERKEFQKNIFLIEREGKLGLGTAYCKGFQWALDQNYERICQMDADFSHDPADLLRLFKQSFQSDLVLGCRYIKDGGTRGWPLHRELLSRSANIYARLLTGIPLHDLTGGFKCFQREALKCLDLASIRSEGYAFQIETTFRVYQQGLTVSEIPIIFKERVEGVSKISRNVVFEAVLIVARLGFERLFHRKKRKI